jgi:uncharacterized membrane protein (DUF4010 family)
MGNLDQTDLFFRLGMAILLGVLIGIEREYTAHRKEQKMFAGVRTFGLFGLLGGLGALGADQMNQPWALVAILLVMGALISLAYNITAHKERLGMTTEVTGLVVLLNGALCYWGFISLAVASAVSVTVLLTIKPFTQLFVDKISSEDVYATLQFAVISAVILPVLPNASFAPPPFDVLNPYKIWLMVVFISGISFLGYAAIKFVGSEQGIGLTGLLGGMVSSTAVTLTFAERSRSQTGLVRPFTLAILISWVVMFVRVLVEVFVVNRALLDVVWLPVTAAGLVGLGYSAFLFFFQRPSDAGDVEFSNPFELGTAIKFGLLYGVILLAARAAQMYLGDAGIYASAILSGLTDVDAITLSMAELSKPGADLSMEVAARSIVLAIASNTVVKGGIVVATASAAMRKPFVPGFLLVLITGLVGAFLLI